jgi:hypothetical protein
MKNWPTQQLEASLEEAVLPQHVHAMRQQQLRTAAQSDIGISCNAHLILRAATSSA